MRISRSHTLGLEEARTRLDGLADELGRELSLTYQWRGDKLEFRGRGVDGHIGVTHSSVDIAVKLGLALKLFETRIRSAIETALDHHIGSGNG
jgi:putative polyhydroxyalkanoate system protein